MMPLRILHITKRTQKHHNDFVRKRFVSIEKRIEIRYKDFFSLLALNCVIHDSLFVEFFCRRFFLQLAKTFTPWSDGNY